MALNTNFDFPPSGYSSPYSSTPTGIRTQRTRFGFSGQSMYPRSRTSTSNTESFSDSMVNNYGTSTSQFDTTFNSENRSSYNDSFNSSGSNYYSANDTFSHGQSHGETSMLHSNYSLRENEGLSRDNSLIHEGGQNMMRGGYPSPRPGSCSYRSDALITNFLTEGISQFDASKYNYNTTFGTNNAPDFIGNFQKNSDFGDRNNKPNFARKPKKKATKMAGTTQSPWKCELCSIEFTSQIPYDMHLRGAKHAKKIKTNLALKSCLKAEDTANFLSHTTQDDKKTFFCELCKITANSSLQLQTHLEGSKHKAKLQPKESITQSEEIQECSKDASTSVNGKTNGSLVRPLPSDFGEPQPSKLAKYACEVCNVAVNSQVQLQQHLTSKKHQNKVEGKPVTKGKKMRKDNEKEKEETLTEKTEETPTEQDPSSDNGASTKVVGVQALASSFVQGETLQ